MPQRRTSQKKKQPSAGRKTRVIPEENERLPREQGDEDTLGIEEPPATEPEGDMSFLGSIPIGSQSEDDLGIFATAEGVAEIPILPEDVRQRIAESGAELKFPRKKRKRSARKR